MAPLRCRPTASTALTFLFALLPLVVNAEPRRLDSNHADLIHKLGAGDYSRRGADTCLGCHDETYPFPTGEVFATRHGHPAIVGSPFESAERAQPPAGLQCEACHGPIGEHGEQILADGEQRESIINFGRRGNAWASLQNGMCLACHEDYEHSRWAGSAHEQADVACADCHRIHARADPVREKSRQVDACTDCHRNVAADTLKRSAHPLRTGAIGGNPLICGDCHDPHGNVGETLTAGNTLNDTCFACHAEKRGPFLWEHAPAAEDCSICHEPHGSNQPALLVRRPPQLCQGCHSSAGHRNLPQFADQLPPGQPTEYLVARACMNCHSEVHGSNHPSGDRFRR